MRWTIEEWAMSLAEVTGTRSTCYRRRVGCVLTDKRGHILATGYNGVATGLPHCNDRIEARKSFSYSGGTVKESFPHACKGAFSPSGSDLDACQAIHAEQNALLQCRDVQKIHTCYVTASPCMTCTKLLLNTGCYRIIFLDEYPHDEARRMWEGSGRVWEKFPPENK